MASIKTNKIFLKKDAERNICEIVGDRINVNNAAAFYNTSILYSVSSLSKSSLCFIERYFSMIADSKNFKEFNYTALVKILSSDELDVDSELQVFTAADEWLSYNIQGRRKYAKSVLGSIRLTLLSDHALKYLLSGTASNYKNEQFNATINEVLHNKKVFQLNRNQNANKVRFCNQSNFNVILCGDYDYQLRGFFRKIISVDLKNVGNLKTLPKMKHSRQFSRAVRIKDEIYIFGGKTHDVNNVSVEKFSKFNNTWENVTGFNNGLIYFCACSFMGNVYIMGGYCNIEKFITKTCVMFDTEHKSWKQFAAMNEPRYTAACAVFEGRIVVSGGSNYGELNTVEAYDHVADLWTNMPNMIERRERHKSASVKNKLFVIGGWWTTTSEVYDSTCNKFVLLKPPPTSYARGLKEPAEFITVGSKLIVFGSYAKSVLFYDMETEVWSEESYERTFSNDKEKGGWYEELPMSDFEKSLRGFDCASIIRD